MKRQRDHHLLVISALALLLALPAPRTAVAADFNSDGYADLAVGTPDENIGSGAVDGGAVATIYGSASGLTTAGNQYWTQNLGLLGTSENFDNFGQTLAAGDFDGDGFIDLAIGVPEEDINAVIDAGLVNVVYGSSTGLTETGNQYWYESLDELLSTSEEGDRFGDALTVGDFNGDGYDDLAVGVPLEDVNLIVDAGAVHVIFGSPDGLSATYLADDWLTQSEVEGSTEEGNHFGVAVVAADFDGDGFDDLAVGADRDDLVSITDSGSVGIIWGSSAGLVSRLSNDYWHQDRSGVADTAEEFDFFGSVLTSGDFDDDGYADLAIGVPFEDVGATDILNAGAVHILYGSSTGITSTGSDYFHQNITGIGSLAEADDRFGETLASGDLNGDRFADLIVGSPHEDWNDTDTGIVQVIWGSSTGLSGPDQLWREDLLDHDGNEFSGDRFGFAIAAGDFDHDGDDDLAVSSPYSVILTADEAGVVFVLDGTPSGLSSDNKTFFQGGGGMQGSWETGDRFGTSLVALPRSNKIFEDDFESGGAARWSDVMP